MLVVGPCVRIELNDFDVKPILFLACILHLETTSPSTDVSKC